MKFNKSSLKKQNELYHTNVDFFRLYHPESQSFVSASCDKSKNNKTQPGSALGLNNFSQYKKSPDNKATLPNHRPYMRKIVDAANFMSEKNLSAKSIFAFETSTRRASMAITWETPDVRIRHIPTGMYIYVNPTPVERPVDASGNTSPLYWTGLTNDPNLFKRTQFTLKATDNQEANIPKMQMALRLEHEISRNGEKVRRCRKEGPVVASLPNPILTLLFLIQFKVTLHMTSSRKHKDLLAQKTELESKSFDLCFSEEKVNFSHTHTHTHTKQMLLTTSIQF